MPLLYSKTSEKLSGNLTGVLIKKFKVIEINISCHVAMYSLSRRDFIYLNEKGEIRRNFIRAVDLER